MSQLKVTICIPTYNRVDYLEQAIRSALSQDYPHLSVIVADNCSTDDTSEMVKQFLGDRRFRYYVNQSNLGMVGNWNKLIVKEIDTEWFVILSDDDYIIDDSYISKAVDIINANEDVTLVYSGGYIEHTMKGEMEKLILPYQGIMDGRYVFLTNHEVKPQAFTLCNILFRRSLALQFNAFSNPENLCCDSELFLKSCLMGNIGVVSGLTTVYRYHATNLITQKRTYEQLEAITTDLIISPQLMAESLGSISLIDLEKRRQSVVYPALRDLLFCSAEISSANLKRLLARIEACGLDVDPIIKNNYLILKVALTRAKPLLAIARKLKRLLTK